MKPTLHLLMGLPGSGKTTLAKQIQTITGAIRLSSDDYRLLLFPRPRFSQEEHDMLYDMLNHTVEHLLQAGRNVIYDANLNRHEHRVEKYELAKKFDANILLWWVQTAPQLAKDRRVSEQDDRLLPDGETAERLFERIADIIEIPDKYEPYIAVDGRSITSPVVTELLHQHGV